MFFCHGACITARLFAQSDTMYVIRVPVCRSTLNAAPQDPRA
jgi:hypothetical protein